MIYNDNNLKFFFAGNEFYLILFLYLARHFLTYIMKDWFGVILIATVSIMENSPCCTVVGSM